MADVTMVQAIETVKAILGGRVIGMEPSNDGNAEASDGPVVPAGRRRRRRAKADDAPSGEALF